MAIFRKAVLATALIGSGLVGTTGMALASDVTHGVDHGTERSDGGQQGAANVDDVQTITPANACNNDVPVNVLGVQVPVQDVAADVPLLSGSEDGGNAGSVAKGCGNSPAAAN